MHRPITPTDRPARPLTHELLLSLWERGLLSSSRAESLSRIANLSCAGILDHCLQGAPPRRGMSQEAYHNFLVRACGAFLDRLHEEQTFTF
jgi:hypothetical protein